MPSVKAGHQCHPPGLLPAQRNGGHINPFLPALPVAPRPPKEGHRGLEPRPPVPTPHSLSSSPSFTWLCGHVHRNILSKFTGQAVELFDKEFRHLYTSSKPVMGLRSPRLVTPLQPRASRSPSPGCLSGSSCSHSDHTSSDPFSSPTGSNPQNLSLSKSSGPSSPLAPNPPLPPRFQPYHGLWGALTPQAHFSLRPRDGPPALCSNLNAYRSTRLQLEQLGLVPRATHIWRPFLQVSPHF